MNKKKIVKPTQLNGNVYPHGDPGCGKITLCPSLPQLYFT